jgi:hypothetical protein
MLRQIVDRLGGFLHEQQVRPLVFGKPNHVAEGGTGKTQ